MTKKINKKKEKARAECLLCKSPSDCCRFGAWIDLEEAKKIVSAGIKGDFFHLEKDKDFPSGYKIGTSYEDESCSFLDKKGLCLIHKFDYKLKPVTCKEFPYENNKLSSLVHVLCTPYKNRLKRRIKK